VHKKTCVALLFSFLALFRSSNTNTKKNSDILFSIRCYSSLGLIENARICAYVEIILVLQC
jgi:hypothetical protein